MFASLIRHPSRAGLLLALLFALAACDAPGGADVTPPTIAGYNQQNGKDALNAVLGGGGALSVLIGRDLRFAALANVAGRLGGCASDTGTIRWSLYSAQSDPTSAGVILLASKNMLSRPDVLLSCALRGGTTESAFSPCSTNYSYNAVGDTVYVFYAATRQSVCDDFQRSLPAPAQ